MPKTIGYIENWRSLNTAYLEPYDIVSYSFITLAPTDGTGKPPEPSVEWDGAFYYASAKIAYEGQIYTSDKFSEEGLRALTSSHSTVKNAGKLFSISIGGWSDLQSTPRLTSPNVLQYRDALVQNLRAISEYLSEPASQLYIDFDWEHLGFHINKGGAHVNVPVADKVDRCLFLGWIFKELVALGCRVSYTTRVNSFYPFQNGRESDVEGVAVSYGTLFTGAGAADLVASVVGKFTARNYAPNLQFFSVVSYVNLMAYDGATGTLSKIGCYSIDDYSTLASALQNVVGQNNLKSFVVGFEPVRQAASCSGSKMCGSSCLFDTEGINIDTVGQIWNIFKDFGGISIWAVNETGFFDYLSAAEAGYVIADLFQVVMGNKQPCGDEGQIRIVGGACVKPYCKPSGAILGDATPSPVAQKRPRVLTAILVISIFCIVYSILSFLPFVGFSPLSALTLSLGPTLLVLYMQLMSLEPLRPEPPIPQQKKYACNGKICAEAPDGTYLTPDCSGECKGPIEVKRYACEEGKCSESSTGAYSSYSECSDDCKAPAGECTASQIRIKGQCVACQPATQPPRDGSRGAICSRASDCKSGFKCLSTNRCPDAKDATYLCRASYDDCIYKA